MENEEESAMVSSYLICDRCGQFEPPASFLNQDGLRLCYQCWYQERYQERCGDIPPESEPAHESGSTDPAPAAQPDQTRRKS
jgi:hypothetical protein